MENLAQEFLLDQLERGTAVAGDPDPTLETTFLMSDIVGFLDEFETGGSEQAEIRVIFWEQLMRKFELIKRIKSRYRVSDLKMISSGDELDSASYLFAVIGFSIVGKSTKDSRFYNVALKILDLKCKSESLASRLEEKIERELEEGTWRIQ